MSTRATIRSAGHPEKLARLFDLIPGSALEPECPRTIDRPQEEGDTM
ncbi:MAG: hypothetical protein PWP08_1463 [Methanofollis sp.]|nr:hypothetical protein [Methanofollis sp.]